MALALPDFRSIRPRRCLACRVEAVPPEGAVPSVQALIRRMSARAVDTKAVEGWYTKRRREVAVRSAADGAGGQVMAERAGHDDGSLVLNCRLPAEAGAPVWVVVAERSEKPAERSR
jgi:predicted metal-dependent phosphoesterase TrpH